MRTLYVDLPASNVFTFLSWEFISSTNVAFPLSVGRTIRSVDIPLLNHTAKQ